MTRRRPSPPARPETTATTFTAAGRPIVRCAIYTRQSVARGEQDFTSCEAQRERGEDYVRAMQYEGWTALDERFDGPVPVVVRSLRQVRSVITSAPPGFGEQPDRYHSDVIFLKSPLTPATAMKVVQLREGVDQAWAGAGVLYFARLSERRMQSRLSKLMGTPEYRLMTVRNWNTTTRLLAMLESGAPAD